MTSWAGFWLGLGLACGLTALGITIGSGIMHGLRRCGGQIAKGLALFGNRKAEGVEFDD